MIADFLTKPLQGKVFQQFRDALMGAVPMYVYANLYQVFNKFGVLIK